MSNRLSKRRNETHWQWRSRLLAIAQQQRDVSQPLITPELEASGEYPDEFVMHIETMTLARAKRRRQKSSLEALCDRNQLTAEQLVAAQQIANVAESIRRNVGFRCASLEARVDCSGSSRSALVEHIRQVRLERAFGKWRVSIRVPRQLIVDMIVSDRSLKDTARQFNVGWPRALRMLRDALDLWIDLSERVARDIDQRDLEVAHARLQSAA